MNWPQTIDLARELFDIREVSCETNPNHLDERLVDVLGQRVQRLSVGVQSFDDGLLKKINRYDRFGSGAETLERIQTGGGRFRLDERGHDLQLPRARTRPPCAAILSW